MERWFFAGGVWFTQVLMCSSGCLCGRKPVFGKQIPKTFVRCFHAGNLKHLLAPDELSRFWSFSVRGLKDEGASVTFGLDLVVR